MYTKITIQNKHSKSFDTIKKKKHELNYVHVVVVIFLTS